ncbi:hypothetical protein D3C73_1636800 [compost metagenome]
MDVEVGGGDFRAVERLVFMQLLLGNLCHARPKPGIGDVTEQVQILHRSGADFVTVGRGLIL